MLNHVRSWLYVNRLSRPIVVFDRLPGLYGLKYDSATTCGLPLYLCSYKLVSSAIAESLIPISNIKDQAPKMKKTQRNLIEREALMAKKNSNKQEAKELAQLIDNLKNFLPKLNQN